MKEKECQTSGDFIKRKFIKENIQYCENYRGIQQK